MAYNLTHEYVNIVHRLINDYKMPKNITDQLMGYLNPIYQSDLENHRSAPMLWIGLYIAVASLVCIIAMVADLIHGFHSRKLWFPCTYFRINAAFLAVISVSVKLLVDLTGYMPGHVDQVAKLGSIAFMCILMANLLPCLATMDNYELMSNITAMCVLVITLVVNVCIQIKTGVVSTYAYWDGPHDFVITTSLVENKVAATYVIFLVVLLMLYVCSSIAILKSKKIIETKYQKGHDRASKDIQPSPGELLTIEKLQKHVINHWVMAGSGSPQFITSCFHTTSASGVICLSVTVLHTCTMYFSISGLLNRRYGSNYSWSMMVIFIVQYVGIVIGTIAPFSRCFATLSYKVSSKIISNHLKVFKVERYWTHRLYDWKHTSIRLPIPSRNLEVVIETLKRLTFNICIGLQNVVVVVCKVIALIPFLFMICFLYCFCCIKWLLKKMSPLLGNKFEKLEVNNNLRPYVLQLEDETELGERTLAGLSRYVTRLIQISAKSQPTNLIKLILEKSTNDFEGVKKFDQINHDVPSQDSWRLPVVTLTTIAVSLPKIGKEEVDSLLESIREGLEYVIVVEKSCNTKNDHASFQKAADTLWQEIRFDRKWLGNQLQNPTFQEITAEPIVEWFRDKAKNIMCTEDRSKGNTGCEKDDSRHKSICANSMYRITETIRPT